MLPYIVFLPLLGSMISGLFSRKIPTKIAEFITSMFLIASAILSWIIFFEVLNGKEETIEILRWIDIGSLKASWTLFLDPLTAVMLIVVTTVSALVHIYSIGYMHDDPHIPRFMSYLSLFTFFMLMLVTSDNLIQLFFGWEGVGLCSYLLIGFWYKKPSAMAAAMKAFIVNRVSDFAFILGIATVYITFDSVNFIDIFKHVSSHKDDVILISDISINAITIMSILLFIGAMGKSAQIGFHTWLPDAMEGPTPVSALIHAATMVTAGVFLVARFSPVIEYSEVARTMITYVGAITAIFAATIALTQNDIKKIIAYSTCSQLGYMFIACGVSAYGAAIFHLMTHAFFKAMLFLSAGSVIHAVGGEQDITKMGALWKKIPVTYAMMIVGSIAIAGIYPLAGYFSKDLILESAFASGSNEGQTAYWVGTISAVLTAFYSWRLIIKVFHGKSNISDKNLHIHEPSLAMLIPLFVLCLGSVFAGIFGEYVGMSGGSFWKESIFMIDTPNILEKAHHIPEIYKLLPIAAGISGIFMAYVFYMIFPSIVKIIMHAFKPIYILFLNKWYFDEIYNFIIIRPIMWIGKFLWNIIDMKLIDGFGPNGMAAITDRFSKMVSAVQSGYVYYYAMVMIVSLTAIITWYSLVWLN